MSAERYRLSGHTGAALRFSFNGRPLTGLVGDTLAAALLANGVHWVARSFKYHRPRGILCAGIEEPNALVTLGSGASRSVEAASCVELAEGLEAHSLNVWPCLEWDLGALAGMIGRFLPAGFYYKTFFWPNWHWFEGLIRRAAGLGVVPSGADPDSYARANRRCDLLVVGSGPAGLTAALTAARAGRDVILAEQHSEMGGTLLWADAPIEGMPAPRWLHLTLTALEGFPNVLLLRRTCVTSYLDHNLLLAVQRAGVDRPTARWRQRLWHLRAQEVVLATGATERPLVFPNNDRPGILLASAVRQYLLQHRVVPGRRLVIATNNDDAYRTAAVALAAGVRVAAIVDSRTDCAIEVPGVTIHRGALVAGSRGRHRVSSVMVRSRDGASRWTVDCDCVAMSGGWDPAVQLYSQSGGKLRFDREAAAFRSQAAEPAASLNVAPLWRVPPTLAQPGKQWVDFHNDVTVADIELAAMENFRSVEHLKRYTTLGMAPDQGKTSNVNGLAVLGELTGRTPGEVGTTTFRPPLVPVSFGVIAGRKRGALFRPARRLPTHRLQEAAGADLQDYGAWLRPAGYPRTGEDLAAAIVREIRAVRTQVGILDYSPLGKIEVAGPDALAFLNGIVASDLRTLKIGRARYSLTLAENGSIRDDGVITRLDSDLFLMGTTSGAAASIYALLEEWHQRECPQLNVWIADVTTQWGVVMLSGPQARAALASTEVSVDLTPEAFPHMAVREATIGGVPARIARVSFTGEVSFEISVPSGFTSALWRHLLGSCGGLGITPVGIEALDVLRLEKGFIHVGGDTDGTTVPDDVGYGAMVRSKGCDFIGRRSLDMNAQNRAGALQLIGLRPVDDPRPLAVGAQLFSAAAARRSGAGHVTSSTWSPSLNAPIALALLERGRSRIGERLLAWNQESARPVEVVEVRRYDPAGARLNG